jgi:hypothetical protein
MKISKFDEGVLFACALMNRLHDCPGIAADTIKEAGLANADVRKMEEFDKEHLRKINEENGINFKI